MSAGPIEISLPTENATARFAGQMAKILRAGDVLLLAGPIGAGKSFFSRSVIRARTQTTEDIPSPTFTLVQTYPDPHGDIWHCDLYRLSSPDEAIELGLDEAFEDSICLIEWPDRLGSLAPKDALLLEFEAQEDMHRVHIHPSDAWENRLAALHG